MATLPSIWSCLAIPVNWSIEEFYQKIYASIVETPLKQSSAPCGSADSHWLFRRNKQFSNFLDLDYYIIEEGKILELFATIAWTMWYRRELPGPLTRISQRLKHLSMHPKCCKIFTRVLPAQSG